MSTAERWGVHRSSWSRCVDQGDVRLALGNDHRRVEAELVSERQVDPPQNAEMVEVRRSLSAIEHSLGGDQDESPDMRFGVIYWIPDDESGIETRRAHPWVITRPPTKGDPMVLASPRTTSSRRAGPSDLAMPGGILPELEEEGWILVTWTQRFPPRNFGDYRLIGRLPQEWLGKLRAAIDARSRAIR
jgi:hypothetical protein